MDTQKIDQGCSSSSVGGSDRSAPTIDVQHTSAGGNMADHESKCQSEVSLENAGDARCPRAASSPNIKLLGEPNEKKETLPMVRQGRVEELNLQNLVLTMENNEYKRKISKIEAEKTDVEKRYDSTLKRAMTAEQSLLRLTRDIESLGDENSQLEFELEDLQECIQKHLSSNLEMKEAQETQEMRHDAEILEMDRNLRTLRDQLALSNSKQLAEKGISGDLKADRTRLKLVVEQLQKMVVDGVSREKGLTADNDRLQKALREQQKEITHRLGPDRGL